MKYAGGITTFAPASIRESKKKTDRNWPNGHQRVNKNARQRQDRSATDYARQYALLEIISSPLFLFLPASCQLVARAPASLNCSGAGFFLIFFSDIARLFASSFLSGCPSTLSPRSNKRHHGMGMGDIVR